MLICFIKLRILKTEKKRLAPEMKNTYSVTLMLITNAYNHDKIQYYLTSDNTSSNKIC